MDPKPEGPLYFLGEMFPAPCCEQRPRGEVKVGSLMEEHCNLEEASSQRAGLKCCI